MVEHLSFGRVDHHKIKPSRLILGTQKKCLRPSGWQLFPNPTNFRVACHLLRMEASRQLPRSGPTSALIRFSVSVDTSAKTGVAPCCHTAARASMRAIFRPRWKHRAPCAQKVAIPPHPKLSQVHPCASGRALASREKIGCLGLTGKTALSNHQIGSLIYERHTVQNGSFHEPRRAGSE